MKKRTWGLAIALALILYIFSSVAMADNSEKLILFWDIPYESISDTQIAELLLKHHGVVLENDPIIDFHGYPMELVVNYVPDRKKVERILLTDAEEAFASEEGFRQLSLRDIEIFVNLDRQLTEQYGEPDYRFFVCGEKERLAGNSRFMFSDKQWSVPSLTQLFDKEDHTFRAWSIWNNVQLELWVRGFRLTQFGYSNVLNVAYYPERQERDIILVDYVFDE